MDSPFYRSYWSYPSSRRRSQYSPPISGEIPVQHPATMSAPRKVVSIPVQHVGSDQNRSQSAVKIQKVFRGFVVRKNVKKIAAIRKEVDEIEKRISTEETAELIRSDSKERLKVNETLMNLLLKLDAVRGLDSGVRECRKAVIKKAISLQEKVDAIVALGEPAVPAESAEGVQVKAAGNNSPGGEQDSGETLETEAASPEVEGVPAADAVDNCDCAENAIFSEKQELPNNAECVPVLDEAELIRREESLKLQLLEEEQRDLRSDSQGNVSSHDLTASSVSEYTDGQTESQMDSSANPNALMGEDEDDAADSLGNQEENAMGTNEQKEESGEAMPSDCDRSDEGKEENKRSRQLLERMMEDNQKIMGMMGQLFERNAAQTRLLSSLSLRVEQLEKAFICERLRRKKKRSAARSAADCSESTLDTKKCCKKR